MDRLSPILRALSPRIRDAVAALLDGEAVLMRPGKTFDFEALRSRQGQAEAILVAYDVMEVDGQDVRPEPLEERRKRLSKLLSRSNKPMREASNSARRSPATAAPSSVMPAG